MSASRPFLQARDLWFSYSGEDEQVLKGVDLLVERGQITMLLGRSGCGKTTLLKIFKGLLSPQKGAVEIHAKNGGAIAYVPQNLGLVRNMTALENVLVGALHRVRQLPSLFRVFPKEVVGEAKQILQNLGLAHKQDEKVYSLSGGERQRVAVGRALMLKPELILADEFVSQLDPLTAKEILDMTRHLAEQGVAFLVTTHETDLASEYADRIVIMRDGRISHKGSRGNLSQKQMLEMLL